VVGWGRDESRNTGTTRLKYAVMPLISKHECSVFWRVDHRNICTVPGLGRSACQVTFSDIILAILPCAHSKTAD